MDSGSSGLGGPGTNWTVNNTGTISSSASGAAAVREGAAGGGTASLGGVILSNSGVISGLAGNGMTIRISGTEQITNTGTISGGLATNGIYTQGTGSAVLSVTNSGKIVGGKDAVQVQTSTVRLINQTNGYILGGTTAATGIVAAIYAGAGGTITNFGTLKTGSSGNTGVIAFKAAATVAGTVIQSGTIIGGTASTVAISFSTSVSSNLLELGAGFAMTGAIVGGTGTNAATLELMSSASTGALTFGTVGSQFSNSNFKALTFDGYSHWNVTATNSAALSGITISGFWSGETIKLGGFVDSTASYSAGTHLLTLTNASAVSTTLTITSAAAATTSDFVITNDGTNTFITSDLPCFAEGTRIATPDGDVAVEALRAGDLVRTASGADRTVRWIGHRAIDLTRHPKPERAQPIRIAPGAFADGIPARPLCLSPEHAVVVGSALVPVRLLRNDATIVREADCRHVVYYHVELATHDMLLAEGLAAETYLDTGNRAMFANADGPAELHPMFPNDQAQRETASCLPFASAPALVEPHWRRLRDRAVAMVGNALPAPTLTADPALHLIAGTKRIDPVHSRDGRYLFPLPPHKTALALASRVAVPHDITPWNEDTRSLGVRVKRLTVRTRDNIEDLALDDPRLAAGWWDTERDGLEMARWTQGAAALPDIAADAMLLEVEISPELQYPLPKQDEVARKAA